MPFLESIGLAGLGAAVVLIAQKAALPLFEHLLGRDKSQFDAMVTRVDALRSEAYGNIWQLTGAFNLFGPASEKGLEDLQSELCKWYYGHGQFLTDDAKAWYFCGMELLGMLDDAELTPTRPDPALLYGDDAHTLKVLREELGRLLEKLDLPQNDRLSRHPGPPGDATYQGRKDQPEIAKLVAALKTLCRAPAPYSDEAKHFAWIVLQDVFSQLRSTMTTDIDGRRGIRPFSLPRRKSS